MFTRVRQAFRAREERPGCGQTYSAAASVPTELLLAILEHLRETFPPDTRTLHAASLVCKHWHAHGANAMLYENILLASHDACILLDRTVAKQQQLAAMIVSLNLLPCPIYPLDESGPLNTPDQTLSIYRHWPDDGRSSRAVLRILSRTPNLEVLAVKAVEYHHRRITFNDLARSVRSKRLRTLSLSGDMSGCDSRTNIESLLTFLCSSPCATLSELVILRYDMSTRLTDTAVWQHRLPRITRLWLPSFSTLSLRIAPYSYQSVPCALPELFSSALVHLSGSVQDPNSSGFITASAVLSGRSWPSLTSLCITGWSDERQPPNPLDFSQFQNLINLELWHGGYVLRHNQIRYPAHLKSLSIVVRTLDNWSDNRRKACPSSLYTWHVFHCLTEIGHWLNTSRRRLIPNLERLCIRADCLREHSSVQLWKVLIYALTLREYPLQISCSLFLRHKDPQPFESHPSKQGGSYDVLRPLLKSRRPRK